MDVNKGLTDSQILAKGKQQLRRKYAIGLGLSVLTFLGLASGDAFLRLKAQEAKDLNNTKTDLQNLDLHASRVDLVDRLWSLCDKVDIIDGYYRKAGFKFSTEDILKDPRKFDNSIPFQVELHKILIEAAKIWIKMNHVEQQYKAGKLYGHELLYQQMNQATTEGGYPFTKTADGKTRLDASLRSSNK